MKPVLKVFVAEHCPGCSDALSMTTRIKQDYPAITVEIIDMGDEQAIVPDAVFATPTFMLNDHVISLGLPYPDEIARLIEEAIAVQRR
jgi:hypothetical protein